MSPDDMLKRFGQADWNTYAGQLDTYIGQFPALGQKILEFHNTFQATAG